MARRVAEITIRPSHTAPGKPTAPRLSEQEIALPTFGEEFPIEEEQDIAFLERFEGWSSTTGGSLPEFICWEFLTIEKRQIPGEDFIFQHPVLGGRTRFGGFILDFFFNMRQEGWRINGERFHLTKPEDRARDQIARTQLSARGLNIIDLWEDDLIVRGDFVLNLAWDRGAGVISKAPFSGRQF